jgi:hypothetical protein
MTLDNFGGDRTLDLVVGVASGIVLVGLMKWRDARSSDPDLAADGSGGYQWRPGETAVLRTMRQSEDEEWAKLLLFAAVAAVVGVAYVSIAPQLMTALTFWVVGLGLGGALSGFALKRRGRHFAPGAIQVLARGLLVGAACAVALYWTLHTTYDGPSLNRIRARIVTLRLVKRPSALTNSFHGHGWWLVGSLALGTFFVVLAALLSVWAVFAALAMTRVGYGSRSRMTMRLARFHDADQFGRWVTAPILVICGFLLCSGLALHWSDPERHLAIDLGSGTTHTAPKKTTPVTIAHVRTPKVSAYKVCAEANNFRVDGSPFLTRLAKTDGAALSGRAKAGGDKALVPAAAGGADWYIRDSKHDNAGLSCLYREVGHPSTVLRLYFVDRAELRARTAAAKSSGAVVVSDKYGVAQLPKHAGKAMESVVQAELPFIRYG